MSQYIDKSAVKAEIEKRIASLESIGSEATLHDNYPVQYAMLVTLKSLKFSIDTLEVKEVDLKKEYDNVFFKDPVFRKLVNRNAGIGIAKHFYELGLKARI